MKKMISTLCALMMAGSMLTLPAAAEEVSTDQPDFQQMSTLADSEITPYYVAIHNIFMDIDKNGNTVSASAECDYLSGYTAKMTVNLQRSTNNSSWTKTLGFGTANGSNGTISLYDSAKVQSGYFYRVQANITIYDGSKVVDSATAYSVSVYIS